LSEIRKSIHTVLAQKSSPGRHCGPQITGGFSALLANLGNIIDLCSPLVAYPLKTSQRPNCFFLGGQTFSPAWARLLLLLPQALSSDVEVTHPLATIGVGDISSCQFSQDEHGRHDTLSWMRFACHSL